MPASFETLPLYVGPDIKTMVPVESMPNLLQQLSLASPLRHYLEITLGIFLRGVGMEILWPHALALVVIGMPLYLGAWLIFRRLQ